MSQRRGKGGGGREGAEGGVWLQSPAKINLGLRILGLREDGYHEVDTWMQQVSLFDRVWIRPGGRTIRVTADRPDVPSGRGNLVHRAAAALREAGGGGRRLGARIHLEKRIPPQAGLGGGSGNAALALWALNRLWGTGLSPSGLGRIAAGLGADVPFFLKGPAGRCRGRGEIVSPHPPSGGSGFSW
ncbi:MAG: 4-(cytidine 5'-diphospho)-2-C-methyl-D-erythritol kinase [bacterium]